MSEQTELCWLCHGKGERTVTTRFGDAFDMDVDVVCEECEGTGKENDDE